jgi:hypothetical protein
MLLTGIAISHAGKLFARVDTPTGIAAVVPYESLTAQSPVSSRSGDDIPSWAFGQSVTVSAQVSGDRDLVRFNKDCSFIQPE